MEKENVNEINSRDGWDSFFKRNVRYFIRIWKGEEIGRGISFDGRPRVSWDF